MLENDPSLPIPVADFPTTTFKVDDDIDDDNDDDDDDGGGVGDGMTATVFVTARATFFFKLFRSIAACANETLVTLTLAGVELRENGTTSPVAVLAAVPLLIAPMAFASLEIEDDEGSLAGVEFRDDAGVEFRDDAGVLAGVREDVRLTAAF